MVDEDFFVSPVAQEQAQGFDLWVFLKLDLYARFVVCLERKEP